MSNEQEEMDIVTGHSIQLKKLKKRTSDLEKCFDVLTNAIDKLTDVVIQLSKPKV